MDCRTKAIFKGAKPREERSRAPALGDGRAKAVPARAVRALRAPLWGSPGQQGRARAGSGRRSASTVLSPCRCPGTAPGCLLPTGRERGCGWQPHTRAAGAASRRPHGAEVQSPGCAGLRRGAQGFARSGLWGPGGVRGCVCSPAAARSGTCCRGRAAPGSKHQNHQPLMGFRLDCEPFQREFRLPEHWAPQAKGQISSDTFPEAQQTAVQHSLGCSVWSSHSGQAVA